MGGIPMMAVLRKLGFDGPQREAGGCGPGWTGGWRSCTL